jgi:hypothetical protein
MRKRVNVNGLMARCYWERSVRRFSVDAQFLMLSSCRDAVGRSLFFYANLSGMLPELPRALNSDFELESAMEISQSGAGRPLVEAAPIDHHCQICPTCSHRLSGHHCKLVCTQCGYYMSCADYY